MDEIRALLENLNQLSVEDLDKLRGLIVAEFERVDGEDVTAENVAALNELADAGDQVLADQARRETEQAEAEAARETARERITALNPPEEETTEEAETPEAGTEETTEAETPAEETPAEPVTASGKPKGNVARMAARQTRPKASPEAAEPADPRTTLIASGETRSPGAELDHDQLAIVMSDALSRRASDIPKGKPGSRGRDVVIASASWADQYPEDRRMNNGDWQHNLRLSTRMDNALKGRGDEALVATGGICAPVNVDWSINMIATADRPLAKALPAYNASRGGLIYRQDVDFSVASTAIGIWTQATDASPAGATKPIYTVACPGTTTTYVDAVTSRIGFGNMQSRFDPETVAANTDAAAAYFARVADNNLLNKIGAACTQSVTTAVSLGATRDLAMAIQQAVAAFRNLHRAQEGVTLRACFPEWVKNLIRIDLARETAHAQDSSWNTLAITDAQIDELFSTWGVSPIWHLDGQATTASGLSGAVNQLFTAQAGSGVIQPFPTKCVWYLWYEGAFQYLDAGTLDLGIVRDSLLDATNDYELFQERFETVIFRGFTGGAVQFISSLCANGGSAGTISTAGSCA